MLFWLSKYANYYSFLNIFRYITFRSIGAIFSAFIIVFLFMPPFINWICKKGSQPIRLDGPESHLLTKQGTPTMGGALVIGAFIISIFLWADLTNSYVWIASFVLIGFGALGAVDDILKLSKQNSKGISAKTKLFYQLLIGCLALLLLYYVEPSHVAGKLFFPFFKNIIVNFGVLFFAIGLFIVIGTSNAVNLTDGLDGLAIGPIMISCFVFMVIAYLTGHSQFANYLHIPFVPKAGELSILFSAIIGAGFGFLWYNAPPAMIIMGDIGAMALGGFLGITSIMIKQELLLAVVGGVFVLEALSVIIQVAVFKRTGRRVFLMAPIHHHFEKKGWTEPTVVFRFWIISSLLGLIALSALKLR